MRVADLIMGGLQVVAEDLEDNGYAVEMGDEGTGIIFYPPDRPWERCLLVPGPDVRISASLAPSRVSAWTSCHPSEIGEFIRRSERRLKDWPLRGTLKAGWTYARFSSRTGSVTLTKPGLVGIVDDSKIWVTTIGHDRFTWQTWTVSRVLAALTEGSAAVMEMRDNWRLLGTKLGHDGGSSPSLGFFSCDGRFIRLTGDDNFRTGRFCDSVRLPLARLVGLALEDGWPPAG